MKKTVTLLLVLAMILSMTACAGKQESTSQAESSSISTENTAGSTAEPVQKQEVLPTKLTNKMTENEHEWVNKHALTLLDEPVKPNADPKAEHKVSIEFWDYDTTLWRKSIEENREQLTEGEYNRAMRHIREAEETGSAYQIPGFVLVDGYFVNFSIPYEDDFADGVPFSFTTMESDENGGQKEKKLSFDTFEKYLEYVRKTNKEYGYTDEENELITMYVQIAYDALRNGDYETLPKGTVDHSDQSHNIDSVFHDYRSDWEYDRAAVEAIKDSIDEISIYDDEMGKSFTVHVTLPPDYDKNKTYPVFFLTDGNGVWVRDVRW